MADNTGARYYFATHRAQFGIGNIILIIYFYLYAKLQTRRVKTTVWLKGGKMASKKNISACCGSQNYFPHRELFQRFISPAFSPVLGEAAT